MQQPAAELASLREQPMALRDQVIKPGITRLQDMAGGAWEMMAEFDVPTAGAPDPYPLAGVIKPAEAPGPAPTATHAISTRPVTAIPSTPAVDDAVQTSAPAEHHTSPLAWALGILVVIAVGLGAWPMLKRRRHA